MQRGSGGSDRDSQLTYPNEYDDKKLEKLFIEDKVYLAVLIFGEPDCIFEELESIFQYKKKGEVIPFIRK